MIKKNIYRPIMELISISIIVYLLHKAFYYFNQKNKTVPDFYYSLETIYSFFFVFSLVIISILIYIRTKNIDNVGFGFLFLTGFKMVCSYILLRPILQLENQTTPVEKINFFLVFALFLAIETVITVRILNKNY